MKERNWKWEELTAPQFVEARRQAGSLCILPIGVMEKHGNHLPLGTDYLQGRAIVLEAVKEEPAVIFPPYYFGQIHEARHVAGTVALGGKLLLDLLFEVCAEIGRNGFGKILIYNSHGGNTHLLNYFAQLALEEERSYSLYVTHLLPLAGGVPALQGVLKDSYDGHAGEYETSLIQAVHPGLVHLKEDAPAEGKVQKGLKLPRTYHGIWWYSESPHHYRGQGRLGTPAKGEKIFEREVLALAETIRRVKADRLAPRLSREFFRKSKKPK
jgi:creatinine amidohydrolase